MHGDETVGRELVMMMAQVETPRISLWCCSQVFSVFGSKSKYKNGFIVFEQNWSSFDAFT